MNKLLASPNLTGRMYLCLSSEDDFISVFSDHFTTGCTYLEAIVDSDGINYIRDDDDVILLVDKNGLTMYVDSNGFVLLDRRLDALILQPISLN